MAQPRVLVWSTEPVAGRMAGPAIRASELARTLAADCLVTLAAPRGGEPAPADLPPVHAVEPTDFTKGLELARRHDVVVAQALPPQLLRELAKPGGPAIVADLYTPIALEALEAARGRELPERRRLARLGARRMLALLAAADLVVCASERQRDLLVGAMVLHGLLDPADRDADPTLRSRLAVVPFGVPAQPPRAAREPVLRRGAIGPGDHVLLWGGGVWDWLDAETPIRAIDRLQDRDRPVHLAFLGLGRPALAESDRHAAGERALGLARELGLLGTRVHANEGWVPYDERGAWLLEADLGASAHLDHLESRFAFRTRLLDCVWAGLPMVTTRGDVLGDAVDERGLGATVAPGDVDGYASAVAALLDDAPRLEAARAACVRARDELTWDRVVEPLRAFCHAVAARPRSATSGATRARRAALTRAVLAQYPATLAETRRREGTAAMARRVARNAGRIVRR